MAKVIMYTKAWCPYCTHAKRLLESKQQSFEEINLEDDPAAFEELRKKTGMRTVPQIFINDELIGGFQELSELDQQGKLEPLLTK